MSIAILNVPLGYAPEYDRNRPAPKDLVEVFSKLVYFQTCVRHLSDDFYECEVKHAFVEGHVRYTSRVTGRANELMRLACGVYLSLSPDENNRINIRFSKKSKADPSPL